MFRQQEEVETQRPSLFIYGLTNVSIVKLGNAARKLH